jgi:hypothetical protein
VVSGIERGQRVAEFGLQTRGDPVAEQSARDGALKEDDQLPRVGGGGADIVPMAIPLGVRPTLSGSGRRYGRLS